MRQAAIDLIDSQPILVKTFEGADRLERFRKILTDLMDQKIALPEPYSRVESELPRRTSEFDQDNRVFASGWAERDVKTQLSRFYNLAVMEALIKNGDVQCYVPHSSEENPSSKCSVQLAGMNHDLKVLYDRLIKAYVLGEPVDEAKIPDHPHCTHVVAPVR